MSNESCMQCGGLGYIGNDASGQQPCPLCYPTPEQQKHWHEEIGQRIMRAGKLINIDESMDIDDKTRAELGKMMDDSWLGEAQKHRINSPNIIYIPGPPLNSTKLRDFINKNSEEELLKSAGLPPHIINNEHPKQ